MYRKGSIFVLIATLATAHSMEKSSMYMEKSGSEDQQTSATGYAYQTHKGEPFSYKSFNSDSSGKSGNYGYPPISTEHNDDRELPLRLIPLTPKYVPGYNDVPVNSYGVPLTYAAYVVPIKGYKALLDSIRKGYSNPQAHGFGLEDTNFSKGGGLNYAESEKTKKGDKGERGYISRHEVDKGLKGEYGNEQARGYYGEKGGNEAKYVDAAGHYANKEVSNKGRRGESFSDSKGNNKGSKTSGYHNIYNKDEYKKDHSFYDKADRRGHFKKYGDYDAKHGAQQAGFVKGGHQNSGFAGNAYGAKGLSDKGSYLDEDRAYKGAAGEDKFYKNISEFANKAGKVSGKETGFSEGDKLK